MALTFKILTRSQHDYHKFKSNTVSLPRRVGGGRREDLPVVVERRCGTHVMPLQLLLLLLLLMVLTLGRFLATPSPMVILKWEVKEEHAL